MEEVEKMYKIVLSESEREVVLNAISDYMTSIPNKHNEGARYLKAWETWHEVERSSEVDINNKMI